MINVNLVCDVCGEILSTQKSESNPYGICNITNSWIELHITLKARTVSDGDADSMLHICNNCTQLVLGYGIWFKDVNYSNNYEIIKRITTKMIEGAKKIISEEKK